MSDQIVPKFVLRPEVAVYRHRDGSMVYASHDSGMRRIYEWSDDLASLTKMLETPQSAAILASSLAVSVEEVEDALDTLLGDEILMPADDVPFHDGVIPRGKQISVWNSLARTRAEAVAGQERLSGATVDVVGLGGVGTWVALNLALAGVGRLRLHDDDVVELSNLVRQGLYAYPDVDKPKVEVAKRALVDRMPEIEVICIPERVTSAEESDRFEGSDFIVGCGDEPDAAEFSRFISLIGWKLQVPHITGGGYAGHSGRLGISCDPANDESCNLCQYADFQHDPEFGMEKFAGFGDRMEALVPVVSMVAAHQSFEVMKMITGLGERHLKGRVGDIDGTDFSVTWTQVPPSPRCVVHGAPWPQSRAAQ